MTDVNPVYPTDYFQLGFNVSASFFGPSAEDIGPWLEQMNLARGVVSQKIAGVINPYLSVIGQVAGNWATVSSFRDALLNAITDLGFEIDYSSVTFTITPRIVPQSPAPAPRPAPRPSTPTPAPVQTVPTPSPDAVYFDVASLPPDQGQAPTPTPQDKGINTTWLLVGFGVLAVVMISRD